MLKACGPQSQERPTEPWATYWSVRFQAASMLGSSERLPAVPAAVGARPRDHKGHTAGQPAIKLHQAFVPEIFFLKRVFNIFCSYAGPIGCPARFGDRKAAV